MAVGQEVHTVPHITRIDHIAVLVDDIEAARAFWEGALGIPLAHSAEVPAEQAQVAFLPIGDSEIELVRPTSGDSGLRRFLEKRGPGMHHICLEVDDLEGMVEQVVAHGVEMINLVLRVGEDGRRYAFVHPKSTGGVLVELYEADPHPCPSPKMGEGLEGKTDENAALDGLA
jgi:methylmalonyl-CoA/ethylmalonyl-CoA epimerase